VAPKIVKKMVFPMVVPIYGGFSHGLHSKMVQPTWQGSRTFIPKARSHYTSTHVEIHGVFDGEINEQKAGDVQWLHHGPFPGKSYGVLGFNHPVNIQKTTENHHAIDG